MMVLCSDRKRKRTEEGCSQTVLQGTNNCSAKKGPAEVLDVLDTKAPAGKKTKGAVKPPKRKTCKPSKATKPYTFTSCYSVGEKLGEGSFGSVFKGQRISDGLQVAIKIVQKLHAASQCHKRGVLHRDIKLENLLINPDTLELKLIDFGCGDFIKKSGFDSFAGTVEYCPPEFFLQGRYHAGPATVWSLGVLLFATVCGDLPFADNREIIGGRLHFRDGLSRGKINESILLHEWRTDN
ncbi:hypothetical protein NFI96_033351, partial [Prochilodus magdalenae]